MMMPPLDASSSSSSSSSSSPPSFPSPLDDFPVTTSSGSTPLLKRLPVSSDSPTPSDERMDDNRLPSVEPSLLDGAVGLSLLTGGGCATSLNVTVPGVVICAPPPPPTLLLLPKLTSPWAVTV